LTDGAIAGIVLSVLAKISVVGCCFIIGQSRGIAQSSAFYFLSLQQHQQQEAARFSLTFFGRTDAPELHTKAPGR
jgi:hypothetical protein